MSKLKTWQQVAIVLILVALTAFPSAMFGGLASFSVMEAAQVPGVASVEPQALAPVGSRHQFPGTIITDYGIFSEDTEVRDTLTVDTIGEYTSAAGVTVDSVGLKDGGATLSGGLTLPAEVEHVVAPTVLTEAITYTAGAGVTGTLATIADGEIWIVYDVFIQTTTTFTDTAGDDETFTIGDGSDADGFLSATSTELASDFTEATGYAAGFFGLENGSNGAYTVDEGIFVYAPSGSDETIDYALASGAGDDIGAGALTMYLVYRRIQ